MAVLVRPADLYVADGQSLMLQPNPGVTVPERVASSVGAGRHVTVARGGTSYSQRNADVVRRVDSQLSSVTGSAFLLDAGGTTDLLVGAQAANLILTMEAYWTARRSAGFDWIVASTVPDSVGFVGDADAETQRQALNALILASSVPDAVADIADLSQLGPSGASADTTYFSDGTHYTNAATLLAGPLFYAALS